MSGQVPRANRSPSPDLKSRSQLEALRYGFDDLHPPIPGLIACLVRSTPACSSFYTSRRIDFMSRFSAAGSSLTKKTFSCAALNSRISKNGRKYTVFGVAITSDRNLQAFHYNVVAFGMQGHFAKPLQKGTRIKLVVQAES
jgi:hypothetical protein